MHDTPVTTIELANTYARYYLENYASSILHHLSGSHPIPEAQLEAYVKDKVDTMLAEQPLVIANSNTLCRYLYECADHALSHDLKEPTSRAAWAQVKDLPSIHHSELNALTFLSADHYAKTVDKMLIDVVGRDAVTTSDAILQAVQSRITQTETGGAVHKFSWGILNDGLWLNGALAKAFSSAKLFRPGEQPDASYVSTAFSTARQSTMLGDLSQDSQTLAYGELDTLIAQVDPNEINALLESFPQTQLNDLLFSLGGLAFKVNHWERSVGNIKMLMPSVQEMSAIVQVLGVLMEAARVMEDPSLISDDTRARMSNAYDATTMSLMAYHALRETKLSQALILDVTATGPDSKVDVLVNGDLINSYTAAGGEEEDLLRFGMYLDPRRGIPQSNTGHSLEYVLARRDDVISQTMAQDADRLEKMRHNDATIIQDHTIRIVSDVVGSYAQSSNTQISSNLNQQIHQLARDLTQGTKEVKLDEVVSNLLIQSINDPSLANMSVDLSAHLNSTDMFQKDHASALTIAEAALRDGMIYVTTDEESE